MTMPVQVLSTLQHITRAYKVAIALTSGDSLASGGGGPRGKDPNEFLPVVFQVIRCSRNTKINN